MSAASPSGTPPTNAPTSSNIPDKAKIANERYRSVIAISTYENNAFWTRSGFMMVAQAAILAGAARLLPTATSSSLSAICLMIASIFAVILCGVWCLMIHAGFFWTSRWIERARALEPDAMDDLSGTF